MLYGLNNLHLSTGMLHGLNNLHRHTGMLYGLINLQCDSPDLYSVKSLGGTTDLAMVFPQRAATLFCFTFSYSPVFFCFPST
jgi:hypothetical protein